MPTERTFGFRLRTLRYAGGVEAERRALEELVRFLAALDGYRGVTFALDFVGQPSPPSRTRGSLDVSLLVHDSTGTAELAELFDDVSDLLHGLRDWFEFAPLADDRLSTAIKPVAPVHTAEIKRRAEHFRIDPPRPIGFSPDMDSDRVRRTRDIWGLWSFAEPTEGRHNLAEALLAQEAPVCVRVLLTPTTLSDAEVGEVEQMLCDLSESAPVGQLGPAATRVLETILVQRPCFEVRVLVASPEPLSPVCLTMIGYAISPPQRFRAGDGLARLEGSVEIDRDHSSAVRESFLALDVSARGDEPERWRRLMGPWEAVAAFRPPIATRTTYPGLDVDVASLTPPLQPHVDDGVVLGATSDGGVSEPVVLRTEDRFRHVYVVGQTGTGKSTLLLRMIVDDMKRGAGVGVIDPHGDLVERVLAHVPPDRMDDVVLVDPSDREAVVGLNLLEAEDDVQARYLVSDLCDFFYQLFDPNRQGIVGPRYETWLRYGALTLMADAEPFSLLEVPRLFVDKEFREKRVSALTDPLLREFWHGEFAQTTDFHRSEVIGWFRSKFEPFRTDPNVRAVIGQSRSTFSMTHVLDEGKILLVNLAKGTLGEYSSRLIGFVAFARIWGATLARAGRPVEERPDFFLYVDEFQNFTTDALPTILSEARKYRLGLTMANQFFDQMPESTRASILGNAGSRLAFRLGPTDATLFSNWLGGDVDPVTLRRLPNFTVAAALLDRGEPQEPVALRTSPTAPAQDPGYSDRIKQRSRDRWARSRADIEREFSNRYDSSPAGDPSDDRRPPPSFLEEWAEKRKRATDTQGRSDTAVPEDESP